MATRAIVIDASPAEYDGKMPPFKEGEEVNIEPSHENGLVIVIEYSDRIWDENRFIPTSDKDNLVLEDVLVTVNQ